MLNNCLLVYFSVIFHPTMAKNDFVTRIVDDDRPIALRKSRRSSVGMGVQSRTNTQSANVLRKYGIHTPPATPKRAKKRVRFSDPGPVITSSSTGLTPFIRRTSLSSTPSSRRRSSAPGGMRNVTDIDDTPISGTLQFAPLRQVLDGRVKRRIKRNRLSEEVNIIEWDKRHAAREKRSEIERLRSQLAAKDMEVQSMRDEQDVTSQIEGEAGGSATTNTTLSARVEEQEREIQALKAELQRKEAETVEEQDWTMAARDPYNFDDDNDDMMITNYDDFSEAGDDIMTTPTRLNTSFPSPPSTNPNTPCKSGSSMGAGIQTSLPVSDAEKDSLRSQLQTLTEEITRLNAATAFTEDHHARLTAKLSDYIPLDESHDHTSLDSALDTVLTQLALSQTQAQEQTHAFSALSTEITNLGFSASSPDEVLYIIASQFRKARLDLEYLAPGENVQGFENDKLLEMLVARVRYLSQRVVSLDANVDEYHEQEILLRQQLNARVSGMDDLKKELGLAASAAHELREEVQEKEIDNERLREALRGYREEVKSLEVLILRVDEDVRGREEESKNKIRSLEDQLRGETLSHDLTSAVNDGNEMVIRELERQLNSALRSAAQVQAQLDAMSTSRDEIMEVTDATIDELRTASLKKDATITQLRSVALDREQAHGVALALSDGRVQELRCEIERVNEALKNAHTTIMGLRKDNGDLQAQLEHEKHRGQFVVQSMLEQMMKTSETALGYINGENYVAEPDKGADANIPGNSFGEGTATIVRKPGLFDGHLARRASGKQKRRRYDSGLGFLEEEHEDEFTAEA